MDIGVGVLVTVEVDDGVDEMPEMGMNARAAVSVGVWDDTAVTDASYEIVGVDADPEKACSAIAPAVLTFETIGSRVSVGLFTKELFLSFQEER